MFSRGCSLPFQNQRSKRRDQERPERWKNKWGSFIFFTQKNHLYIPVGQLLKISVYLCCFISVLLQNSVCLPEDAVAGAGGRSLSDSALYQSVPGTLPHARWHCNPTSAQVESRERRKKSCRRETSIDCTVTACWCSKESSASNRKLFTLVKQQKTKTKNALICSHVQNGQYSKYKWHSTVKISILQIFECIYSNRWACVVVNTRNVCNAVICREMQYHQLQFSKPPPTRWPLTLQDVAAREPAEHRADVQAGDTLVGLRMPAENIPAHVARSPALLHDQLHPGFRFQGKRTTWHLCHVSFSNPAEADGSINIKLLGTCFFSITCLCSTKFYWNSFVFSYSWVPTSMWVWVVWAKRPKSLLTPSAVGPNSYYSNHFLN